jgi:hypothetical protein
MAFTLPNTFSKKIKNPRPYIVCLNALAEAGYSTPADLRLKANTKAIIETIKELTGNDDTDAVRNKRRYYISAILWVMTPAYRAKTNPYYQFYQECLPSSRGGEAWVKRTDYTPESTEAT